MIATWGEEFRPQFKKIGELVTLFPDATQVALTATATENAITGIKKDLNMKELAVIRHNPDRPNIFLEIRPRPPNIRKFEKYDALIGPYCKELQDQRQNFEMIVIYVDNLDCMGYAYRYLEAKMGDSQYNGYEPIPENRIFGMYNSKYTKKMKDHIVKELRKKTPVVRLVLATVALGMGLNAPSISSVIHFRPPTSLQQFFQEIGRAGRSGQPSSGVMYYNNSDIAKNRTGMTDEMREYCRSQICLRITLVKYFLPKLMGPGQHDLVVQEDRNPRISRCNPRGSPDTVASCKSFYSHHRPASNAPSSHAPAQALSKNRNSSDSQSDDSNGDEEWFPSSVQTAATSKYRGRVRRYASCSVPRVKSAQ
ncbi:ATP-dependent DNA helicase RecQ-like [Lineus longissimus]|uniref:ATP-dependent DNA helicase RecQ-like n=1 Tax=Lineus longissimus TaxID=88925 RepID=UPI00315DD623